MHPDRAAPAFADISNNVVNLGRCRGAKQFRSFGLLRPQRPSALRPPKSDYWPDDDYRERMKVNAAVFVFLIFLIISGVWLLDGLSDSFGSDRLSHQHAQARDISLSTAARLANGVHSLL